MPASVPSPAHQFESMDQQRQSNKLGMWLFLASLAMLFGGCLVGFIVIRLRALEWPPAGSPGLPTAFWISAVLLALISVLLVLAL